MENRSIKNVDESKKIQFKDNEILFNKQRYKVNNVTMQILDSNADVVGEYTKQGVIVFKNNSQNESHYILKSSRLYKNTTKK
ncbi:TPA: hypothetical protein ACGPAW_000489 [Streptococcus suis]|nr:hypothetical protein [Streptococcus suis]